MWIGSVELKCGTVRDLALASSAEIAQQRASALARGLGLSILGVIARPQSVSMREVIAAIRAQRTGPGSWGAA